MCVTVHACQEFSLAHLLCLFCTFMLHCVFFPLKLQIHTCYSLEYKWEYDVKTQQKLGIRAAVATAVLHTQAWRSISRVSSMITYPTVYFQLFPFLYKDFLLTTTTLLLLEGSVKVATRTSTFMSSSLFWGHRSCRHPGFKLRLSISTELGVLVGTFCRGQRSHLGHSFYALTLFPHFPLRSVPRGLFIITRSLCASKGCFGLLESSPWLQTCFPARCCDTGLSVKSFR